MKALASYYFGIILLGVVVGWVCSSL